MRKILFLAIFVSFSFSLTYPDFSKCYEKFHNYKNLIPISKNYSITTIRPKNFVWYDKLRGVYLVKHKNRKFLKFYTHYKLGFWIASISDDTIFVGNFARKSRGVELSKISSKTMENSVMSDIFCHPIGVGVGKDEFLTKKEIYHILHKGNYGDTRFEFNRNLVITKLYPYGNNNFKVGDKIISKLNYFQLEEKILYSKVGSYINFNVLRNGKKIRLKAKIFNRFKRVIKIIYPNYLKESGLVVDKNLRIVKVLKNSFASKHYIFSGTIYKVNEIPVFNRNEANAIIYKLKNVTITIKLDGLDYNFKYNFKVKELNGKI